MPENQTRRITHGAMMVALFTILLAISTYVPVVSIVTIWFISLPIAWYSAKYSRSSSIFVVIVSIVISLLFGGLLSLPIAILFAIIGFVIGDVIRTKKSKIFLFMSTAFTVLISITVGYIISVKFFNMDILKQALTSTRESYQKSNEIVKSITGQAPISTEQLNTMFNTIQMVMPSVVTLLVFIMTFIVISVNLPLLRRFGLEIPKFAPFRDLRIPRATLWYYLAVLAMTLFVKPEAGTFIYIVLLNLSFILSILFMLQGISLIHFYVYQQGWPKWTLIVGTILALPLSSFVTLLGIADLGFNIRGLISGMTRK
ncbi:YybS family protein [Rummeliibacillus sp. NPDC094406]|uniref:YybS family protein n=1 Tax=Rummeliibacillus sp. NPDC094406 TaxID=3364511 RepID=UPI00382C7CE6